MNYRIVRVYERFYVEGEARNKFFMRYWRRVSPRGGFDTKEEAKKWFMQEQAARRCSYEVVEDLPPRKGKS